MAKHQQDHGPFYEEVGRRVREARTKRQPPLTQEGLAQMVGLTRTSITNLEQGRQKCLLHTLADIAVALEVEVATLLPNPIVQSNDLNDALKNRLPSEKEWIMSTLTAAENGTQ